MKMLYITANISILDELTGMLDRDGISSYQVIERAWVKPAIGDKRLDDAVWPGYNSIIFVQINEKSFDSVISGLKKLNSEAHNENELVTWASWTLDSFVAE